jgi:peptidoglycan/LPS O-acetylase OafA/YrhL
MAAKTAVPQPSWLAHLSLRRIVVSNKFIPQVDGFRFLAILIVVVAHIFLMCPPPVTDGFFAQQFHRAFSEGKHGVYLFFTISGFILALPFARHHLLNSKPVALGSYFKRRITRLEPPYIIVMLLRAPALMVAKTTAASVIGLHLLASLGYVHNLVFARYSIINPPAWSLEIEIQFYLLAPLLSLVFCIRPMALRRTVILLGILFSGLAATIFIPDQSRISLTLLNYFQYFAAGFLLCDFYLLDSRFSLPSWAWDVVGIVTLFWILMSRSPWYPVILPFATIGLYMAGFYGMAVRWFFSIPAITIIGGMCYSLYLTHPVVLTLGHALQARISMASWPVMVQTGLIFAFCLGGILAVGTVYFVLIERPCMDPNWPRQLSEWMKRQLTRPTDRSEPDQQLDAKQGGM